MEILLTKNISNKSQSELLSGLQKYNVGFVNPDIWHDFGVFVHDDAGNLEGGLIGKRKGDWFCIDFLWVAENMRSKKLGSKIVMAAENRMRDEGCLHMQVDTFSFQALPFYEKLGFKLNHTIDDFPLKGMSRYYLTKKL